MSQKRLWIAAAIIGACIVVGFLISIPHTTRDEAVVTKEQNVMPLVALRDSYKKGQHTIAGSVTAPTACAAVTATATFLEEASSTGRIAVALSLSNETGVCLQLPTPLSFSVTLAAPAALPISVTVNGVEASTTAL